MSQPTKSTRECLADWRAVRMPPSGPKPGCKSMAITRGSRPASTTAARACPSSVWQPMRIWLFLRPIRLELPPASITASAPPLPATASASISTRRRGSIRLLTSTSVVAGRILPNTSPCTWPSASASAMSVTNIRVRTTSSRHAPALCKDSSIMPKICFAWARILPSPTTLLLPSTAVVPEMKICAPVRTALL